MSHAPDDDQTGVESPLWCFSLSDPPPKTDPDWEGMQRERLRKMNSIKELIDHGAYSVDAKAVADAIVRRMISVQTGGRSGSAGSGSSPQDRSE